MSTNERPILFSGPMVRAILEGTKTMTRRVVKPQPETYFNSNVSADTFEWKDRINTLLGMGPGCLARFCPYGQPGDRLWCYLCAHEHYTTSGAKADTGFSERRLHGRGGRPDLQQDQIRGIRQEGPRGLVSIEGAPQQQGVSDRQPISRKQEGDEIGSQTGVHGVPRDAREGYGDAAHQRQQGGQPARESVLGNGSGELAGQANTRNIDNRRKAPFGKVHERGEGSHSVGNPSWALQPEAGGSCAGCNAVVDKRYRVGGTRLWVRETWRVGAWNEDEGLVAVDYAADNHSRREWLKVPDHEQFERLWIQSSDDAKRAGMAHDLDGLYRWKPGESPCRWRSSIHMPRWASRILLEVTEVRVERVQEITGCDAMSEGIVLEGILPASLGVHWMLATSKFTELWDSINKDRGYGWDANPFVWVINFKRIEQ